MISYIGQGKELCHDVTTSTKLKIQNEAELFNRPVHPPSFSRNMYLQLRTYSIENNRYIDI